MIYLELFLGFLRIGLFSFGGAYAAIPLIRETVLSYGWITEENLAYMIAVSESTPGPIMVNMATYIGSSQGGVFGAVIATAAVVAPAFIIVLLLTALFKSLAENRVFRAGLSGVKACVAGVILATGAYMAATNCFEGSTVFDADVTALVMTAALAALYFGWGKIFKKGMSPLVLIFIAAAAGVLVYGWK
ncbi:MAG: chromate transporter [Clostridia bacterium]|nr:chromate transporter [Clostridia bacterium]